MHFASVGSDNGHDGSASDGTPFLNHPEVLNDFAFRAIHTEAVIGKQIVEAYYDKKISKSYYLGCSTGGRQAIQSALKFPDDFDGLVAGSPATDWNHLASEQVFLGKFVGAPNPNSSAAFIPADLWPIVSQEFLNQCDDLDGIDDGIISDPDLCIFRPEALLCDADSTNTSSCLTPSQVGALKNIYQPIFNSTGQLMYPRYDPRGESDGNFINMFSGQIFNIAAVSKILYMTLFHFFNGYGRDGFKMRSSMTPIFHLPILLWPVLLSPMPLILEASPPLTETYHHSEIAVEKL